MPELPPANRVPQNLAGMRYLKVTEIGCGSYCPLDDGEGPATQVHLHIKVEGLPVPIMMRMKTKDAVDNLIAMLERHRNDVWPSA